MVLSTVQSHHLVRSQQFLWQFLLAGHITLSLRYVSHHQFQVSVIVVSVTACHTTWDWLNKTTWEVHSMYAAIQNTGCGRWEEGMWGRWCRMSPWFLRSCLICQFSLVSPRSLQVKVTLTLLLEMRGGRGWGWGVPENVSSELVS